MNRQGFSLVELSVVLVILGLLVGGIMAGQSLIHASELRKAGAEFQRYETAVISFREKYQGLPGDLRNAESFWGTFASPNCTSAPTLSVNNQVQAGTCNGNNDGHINGDPNANLEMYRAWQHLQLAGLLEGKFLGTRAYGSYGIGGINMPASTLVPNAYALYWADTIPYQSFVIDSHVLLLGKTRYTDVVAATDAGITPEDAWNIDKKIDDGAPTTGRMIGATGSYNSGSCIGGSGYTLDNKGIACMVMYKF